jgi:hypothetical protein
MSNIIDKINALKFRIENNAYIQAYCAENFSKPMQASKEFRNRVELQLNDLPLTLITRPSVNREPTGNVRVKNHSVLLYIGFHETDKNKALEHIVALEELYETAVAAYTSLTGDKPMAIAVGDTINDEGAYHPSYFMVMQLTIKDR